MLVLLMAVGAAILYLSSGESSLVGNQRASSVVWWAAKGGLEEAHSRLWRRDPAYLGSSVLPADKNHVVYILNPASGETVAPAVSGNAYFDTEYQAEWGQPITTSGLTITTVNSDMQTLVSGGQLLSNLPYKWIRLTIKTEASASQDVNQDGILDATTPIYYDNSVARQNLGTSGNHVYRATALAKLPDGTTSMLQYDLGPDSPLPGFPAALTLCGSNATLSGPNSNVWYANGNDSGSPPGPNKEAIGTCNATSTTSVISGIPGIRTTHYIGVSGLTPDVINVSSIIGPCLQSVSCLNNLVLTLTALADQVLTGPVSNPNLGTAANPLITVVNGDLDRSAVTNGYGILVVTGTYTAAGNSSFNGILLVIGQGIMNVFGGGNGSYNGAVVVSKIKDPSGTLLSTPGVPVVNWAGGGGNGIYYNSSLINLMSNLFPYKVSAFREINQ